ncbi:MAG: radical SAM protein [Megasphaera sp.]|nr:radical SAM protein [Megasphaera sp.]MCH4218611.1 radical SAM protein [Megasphaera sp.]
MGEHCRPITLQDHPCFNVGASASWGRVHLPVAPNCNIQCNFCNRMYDCVNENRPGVTGHVYTPAEAVDFLDTVMARRSDISVVGIAGPGDPLCEPENTLETFRLVHARYPELILCLSTNGLNLPGCVQELVTVGVSHVTVTVNAVDPDIAKKVYAFIHAEGQVYEGRRAGEILLRQQEEGIRLLKQAGLTVKINTVVVPGINMDHVVAIAEKAGAWGADIMNCMAMIPVHDTPFATIASPANEVLASVRKAAEVYVPQMWHCCRCRADAVGRLCEAAKQQSSCIS